MNNNNINRNNNRQDSVWTKKKHTGEIRVQVECVNAIYCEALDLRQAFELNGIFHLVNCTLLCGSSVRFIVCVCVRDMYIWCYICFSVTLSSIPY